MNLMILKRLVNEFGEELQRLKQSNPGVAWYPYDTLGSFNALGSILTSEELTAAIGAGPVLDVGTGDGLLAFMVERIFEVQVTAIDNPPTNYNELNGFKAMRRSLKSNVTLIEMDLDAHFKIDGTYPFSFFLGILYHLKNPFLVLETLSRQVQHLVLSTKIAKRATPDGADLSKVPCAIGYDPDQGGDHTNYWIFTEAGLRWLFARTGWVLDRIHTWGAENSDVHSPDRDQRAFCYLASARFRFQR